VTVATPPGSSSPRDDRPVAEALADPAGVREVFATEAGRRHAPRPAGGGAGPGPAGDREGGGVAVGDGHPQGLVAVCALRDVPADVLVHEPPRLAVALAELADPGNAGTVLRTADRLRRRRGGVRRRLGPTPRRQGRCAPARAASSTSTSVRGTPLDALLPRMQAAGATVLAADGGGEAALDELGDRLAGPVVWLFGNEARGVPADLAALADARVRIPMRGRAESLNLAAAAAICLYTTQLAQG
jgi:TrmH family RNA methyltransferase